MKKLDKFTLSKNKKDQSWDLKNDSSKEVVKKFDTKEQATVGGALSGALGSKGGSVKIRKTDGTFQEERTFPRGKDPKESRG